MKSPESKCRSSRSLSIAQIADMESRDYDTVYRWITEGFRGVFLRAKKLGKCWSILIDDLEAFREACNAASGGLVAGGGHGGPLPSGSTAATSTRCRGRSRRGGKFGQDGRPTLEQRAAKAAEKLKKMGL